MRHLIGQTLASYRIDKLIAQNDPESIFQAYDTQQGRLVILKVLLSPVDDGKAFQTYFMTEAERLTQFTGPGLTALIDYGATDRYLYVVSPDISGPNLQQLRQTWRDQDQWPSQAEAVSLVYQFSRGLGQAHQQNIIHGWLKPKYILIQISAAQQNLLQALLLDVGLGRLFDKGLLTLDETDPDTWTYLSPEQALGGSPSPRSDIYALGMLLYELLIGQAPFVAHSMHEAIQYHRQATLPSPRALAPDLPEALEAVILTALAPEPANRFGDAQQLTQVLEDFLAASPSLSQQLISSRLDEPTIRDAALMGQECEAWEDRPPLIDPKMVNQDDVTRQSEFQQRADLDATVPAHQLDTDGRSSGTYPQGEDHTHLDLSLAATSLILEPGQATTMTLVIENRRAVLQQVEIAMAGIPSTWISQMLPVLSIPPHTWQELVFTIQPSRVPQSEARAYPLVIRVTSQDDPRVVATLKETVMVAAYEQIYGEIWPQHIKSGETAQLTVENQGNRAQSLTLRWMDPTNKIFFQPAQTSLALGPGEQTILEFQATRRGQHIIGGQKRHAFSIDLSASTGLRQAVSGEVTSQGLVPIWVFVITLLIGAGLLVVGRGIFGESLFNQVVDSTAVTATETVIGASPETTPTPSDNDPTLVPATTPSPEIIILQTATPTALSDTPISTPRPTAIFTPQPTPALDPIWLSIPSGFFSMGSDDEQIEAALAECEQTEAKETGEPCQA